MVILTFPNEKLRQKSKRVLDTHQLNTIILSMQRVLRRSGGVALAAPQVGVMKRFFITNHSDIEYDVVINPEFTPTTNSSKVLMREGCLSIPGVSLEVPRWDIIQASFQNSSGQSTSALLSGFCAQVFQHETDHLDGVLMVDRLTERF